MAIYDGVLNVVLRNPFEDKSKFFKKSQYVFGPRFILGTVFAFVGGFGFATSGLVWEFKGIELGLTALITSFIAFLFGIVFLFPFSKSKEEQSLRQNNIVKVKTNPSQAISEAVATDAVESVFPFIFIFLWSSAFITTKPIIDNSDPFAALAFRFALVALGFFIFSLYASS